MRNKRTIDYNIDKVYDPDAYIILDFIPASKIIYSVKVVIHGDVNARYNKKNIDIITLTTYVEERQQLFFRRIARRTKLTKIHYIEVFYIRPGGKIIT